jgi:hypothetical protein
VGYFMTEWCGKVEESITKRNKPYPLNRGLILEKERGGEDQALFIGIPQSAQEGVLASVSMERSVERVTEQFGHLYSYITQSNHNLNGGSLQPYVSWRC